MRVDLNIAPSTVILGLLKHGQGFGLNILIYRIPTKKIFYISKTEILVLTELGVGVSGNLGIYFASFQVTHGAVSRNKGASTTSACSSMLSL